MQRGKRIKANKHMNTYTHTHKKQNRASKIRELISNGLTNIKLVSTRRKRRKQKKKKLKR